MKKLTFTGRVIARAVPLKFEEEVKPSVTIVGNTIEAEVERTFLSKNQDTVYVLTNGKEVLINSFKGQYGIELFRDK